MSLRKIEGNVDDNSITVETPVEELRANILSGDIVVLKNVFEPEAMRNLRNSVFEWGQETPQLIDSTSKKHGSFHSIDINPDESAHPKVYHSYNFVLDETDNSDIDKTVRPFFETVRDFQNRICGTDGDFGDLNGLAMRPIIIHYPRGGGGFPLHTHPFLPQKIGLIISLSEYETDYKKGGTRFAVPGGDVIDIEGEHTIGDIALFRIDLPHNVHPCDPEADLDFDEPAGRWSLILPYNHY